MLINQYFAQNSSECLVPKISENEKLETKLDSKPSSALVSEITTVIPSTNTIFDTANQLLNQTVKIIDGAYADSTIRAYRVDFEHFIKYCEELNECPLPTTPETICCKHPVSTVLLQ